MSNRSDSDQPEAANAPLARIPRTVHSKARRDEILEQATRLFAERGYEGTSMADLASRVGMRKASLFYHFESKDALYALVLEKLVSAVAEAIATALHTKGSFVERLDRLSEAITTVLGEQPYAARLLIREALDWGPIIRSSFGDSVQSVLAAAQRFVEEGQAAGAFVKMDPKQLIVSLIGVHLMPFAIGGVVQRFTGMDPFDAASVGARREAVRDQIRELMVVKGAT